jgi:hypothetical protein
VPDHDPSIFYQPFQGGPSLAEKCPELVPRVEDERIDAVLEYDPEYACEGSDWLWVYVKKGQPYIKNEGQGITSLAFSYEPKYAKIATVTFDATASALWHYSLCQWAREWIRKCGCRDEKVDGNNWVEILDAGYDVLFARTDSALNTSAHALHKLVKGDVKP